MVPILFKISGIFQEIEEKEPHPNRFSEATIMLIPKGNRDTTKKGNTIWYNKIWDLWWGQVQNP